MGSELTADKRGGLRRERLVFRTAPRPRAVGPTWSTEDWGWATVRYFFAGVRYYREIRRAGVSSFQVQCREAVPEEGVTC